MPSAQLITRWCTLCFTGSALPTYLTTELSTSISPPGSAPIQPCAFQPPARYALKDEYVFTDKLIFRLVGEKLGHTAMSESYIRIHGEWLTPGTWKIRVSGAFEFEF